MLANEFGVYAYVSDDLSLSEVVLMVRGLNLLPKHVFSVVILWEGVDGEGKFVYAPQRCGRSESWQGISW